jgi:MerR family transcriptional regulator/heat shock protein HspR
MAKRPASANREDRQSRATDSDRPSGRALYIISVAAELGGVHPQTLRIYERKGLLSPARTSGGSRRYSDRDIARLKLIQRLTQKHGLNLAGVKMIVEMENELERMRARVQRLDRELEKVRVRTQEEVERVRREVRRAEILPLSTVRRLRLRIDPPRESRRGPIEAGPGGVSAP